ncbi:hypothetical protein DNTS_001266 [Danionella cerebrum]|uniref:Ig-like domain-containing protein n=1 Tax=Danionella cerebrum TaxID=2873325 RepID=A0A553MZV0_9TELE|nr:hypothetical protein DNTS_001266 [Danionella translucida]
MWCSHNLSFTGNIYWFKQTDNNVPITILHTLYTESLTKYEPIYYNGFTEDHLVMNIFKKNTSLTINHVTTSDSGFYFCGASFFYLKFSNGTRLEIQGDGRQRDKQEEDSVEYAAVHFSSRSMKPCSRNTS